MSNSTSQIEIDPTIAEDPRWELVERIVASPSFAKSRLCSILLYICELSLLGRNDEISELSIGATVFGRAHNYDPSVDGIVRSHASRLRQRLDQYFSEEGAHETIRLSIPKGGYVPVFQEKHPPPTTAEIGSGAPSAVTDHENPAFIHSAPASGRNPHRRLVWTLSLALFLACICIVYLLASSRSRAATSQNSAARHPFWRSVFSADRPTVVVCSDTGLTILENLTGNDVSLADYLSGNYRAHINHSAGATVETAQILAEHRYTSIVDTEIVSRLYRVAGESGNGIQVRYSRDIRPNDLKTGSVILLGTQAGTPWIELFQDRMNFRVQHNHQWGSFSVMNRSPQGNELARYNSIRSDPAHKIYGLVALRPNLGGSGQVLILEGTSMAGTESAADFVFDDGRLLPFLDKIRRPNGSLPYFELLLQSSNMNGNASQSEIVGYRTSSD
jgi:hypothetical protein